MGSLSFSCLLSLFPWVFASLAKATESNHCAWATSPICWPSHLHILLVASQLGLLEVGSLGSSLHFGYHPGGLNIKLDSKVLLSLSGCWGCIYQVLVNWVWKWFTEQQVRGLDQGRGQKRTRLMYHPPASPQNRLDSATLLNRMGGEGELALLTAVCQLKIEHNLVGRK